LHDWIAADHMVHFVIDAVKALDLSLARTNIRSTGHAQYPPSMMLGPLIYCHATGTFSSRRIETLTHEKLTAHQANDKQQLIPTLAAVSPVIPRVTNVLVDSG
jgi:transposase